MNSSYNTHGGARQITATKFPGGGNFSSEILSPRLIRATDFPRKFCRATEFPSDRISCDTVPKEPIARRLIVHKVIESVLHPSYDHESGIEGPSIPLLIGIPYSNKETHSPPREREFTTRTFPASALKSYTTY